MTTRCGASSPVAPSDTTAGPVAPKRTRRWLVFTLLTLLPLGFILSRRLRADFAPQFSLTVLGQEWTNRVSYTEFLDRFGWDAGERPELHLSTQSPDRSARVRTNAQILLVRVRVRNDGTDAVAQNEWRGVGYSKEVQISGLWFGCREYHLGILHFDLIQPGESRDLILWFPPDAKAWRLSWTAQSASLNYRARWHLVQRRMSDIPASIASWLLGPLGPADTGHVLKSPAIPVEIGATPREPSPLQITEYPLGIPQYRATARKKVRTPPRPVHASSPPSIPAPEQTHGHSASPTPHPCGVPEPR